MSRFFSTVINKITSYSTSQSQKIFNALLDGFDLKELANELYDNFKKNITDKPGKQEIIELQAFLKKAKYEYLDILVPVKKKDYAALSGQLDRLSESSYEEIAELLMKKSYIPMNRLICLKKIDTFLTICVNDSQTDPAIRAYIPGLIKKRVAPATQDATQPADTIRVGGKDCFFCTFLQSINKKPYQNFLSNFKFFGKKN